MFKRFISVLIFLIPLLSFAHPHMFVAYDITFIADKDGIKGVKMNWDMDPMFSASLIESFDTNKNRKFEKNETIKIRDEAFSNLANYHYMTFIHLDGKPAKFNMPENFSASIVGEEVRYTFTLPIKIDSKKDKQKLEVEVFDESNFIYFSYSEKVAIDGASKEIMDYSITVAKKKAKDQYLQDVVKRIATLLFSSKA